MRVVSSNILMFLVALVLGLVQGKWVEMKTIVDPSTEIPLLFAIKNKAVQYSGPQLSLQQVRSIFTDHKALSQVEEYIRLFDITSYDVTLSGDFIKVMCKVGVAEQMLPGSKFFYYKNTETGQVALRCNGLEIPANLPVDFIGHSKEMPWGRRHSVRTFAVDAKRNSVSPQLIMKTYKMDSNVVKDVRATQGLFESLNQSYSQDDLSQYLSSFNLLDQQMAKVIGPDFPEDCFKDGGENCGEANLDAQVILALAQNSPTTYYSVPAPPGSQLEPFYEWILTVANDTNPPLVHSISYGDSETMLDPSVMTRFSSEVMKLGLRGVSVLAASGDDGIPGYEARTGSDKCGWNPGWPSSDPYVTAVGATQGPEAGSAEVACSSSTEGVITSGGGFSDVFDRPSYQDTAVNQFVDAVGTEATSNGMFNVKGRAYPDVSLLGYNYAVVVGGKFVYESGTSASTPAFAAMITLINGERLALGKEPLGFLNPKLYAAPTNVYIDITEGENFCTAGRRPNIICCKEGFSARAGWDPVTGLGSINYPEFKQYMVDLE